MSNTYQSINQDAVGGGGGGGNPPYSSSFLVASWNLNVDKYEITISEATHERGAAVLVQVYELDTGVYKEVGTDITVSAAGNITITIAASPDLRFDGKVVITGE